MRKRTQSTMAAAVVAALVVITSGAASAASLAAGSLDPTFDTDGRSEPVFGSTGRAVIVQPDGRIVAIAYEGTGRGYRLVRYEPDGQIAGSTWTGELRYRNRPPLIASQIDGGYKTIIRFDHQLLRYDETGALDRTFGTNGRASNPNDYPAWTRDIEVTENGDRIVTLADPGEFAATVVAGYQPPPQAIFAFTREGQPDQTFGTAGMVLLGEPLLGSTFHLRDLTIQPDGKIVATGGRLIVRLLPNGELDESFGTKGIVINLDDGKINDHVQADSQGRLLVLRCDRSPEMFTMIPDKCQIMRHLADGTVDHTYGDQGRVVLPDHAMGNLEIDSSGRSVVFGVRWEIANPDLSVTRLLEDGSLDASFGDGGVVSTPSYYLGSLPAPWGALQPDDRIVRVGNVWEKTPWGHYSSVMYAWRYLAEAETQDADGSSGTTQAQLTGWIGDAKLGTPISGALVDCGEGRNAISASDGTYTLELPVGPHFCTASATGYRSQKARVEMTEAGAVQDFHLR